MRIDISADETRCVTRCGAVSVDDILLHDGDDGTGYAFVFSGGFFSEGGDLCR